MSALLEKLKKNSKLKYTDSLMSSSVFGKKEIVATPVPAINIALSGEYDGGLSSGLLMLAGPSKHFKTAFALLMVAAYMKKHQDAVLMFFDSEFGAPESYFKSFGIDVERVLHIPITNVEEFKFEVMNQLENIERKDKVIMMVDSVGNLASKKEVDDAKEEKSVADMTRAKQIKSVFRMVTPHLTLKDIPMIVVNHIYMTQEMFSKPVVSGGCLGEDEMIKLSDGTPIKISDVEIGMKVLTMDGEGEVSRIWNPNTLQNGNPECYRIHFEDGSSVVCSDSHEFLIDSEWVEAKKLIVGAVCTTV